MKNLLPGARVSARNLLWEVVETAPAGEQQRFRLRNVQGDLRGMEIDLLHPFEPIKPVSTEIDPTRASRLKHWLLYHQSFLLEQALGPSAFLAVQPGRLEITPFQLVPLMRALRMGRPRLLLADGVGLGKTIQAGLIMAELIARRRTHRILIVSPAGPLLNQWHREMRTRFGLRFTTIKNAGELQESRRGLVLGANPFDHVAFCLTSIDFAKQDKVLQDLERSSWDLVVIDEAHHCQRMGRAGDWEDSRRRRLAELLARQADGLLLLTATPHDGYDPHFASLVELLDPSLVDGRGSLRGERYHKHVIRRLKDHITDPETGAPLFKKREVTPRAVRFDQMRHPRFAAYQKALMKLVVPLLRRAKRRRRYEEVLAFVALLKRSTSTAVACRNTLEKIRDRYTKLVNEGQEQRENRRQRLRTLRDYRRRLERYGALSFEEEQDQGELEAEDMAAELMDTSTDNEDLDERIDSLQREQRSARDRINRITATRAGLEEVLALAEAATREDPKPQELLHTIATIRATESRANILVYTEYTDSLDEVVRLLHDAVARDELSGEVVDLRGSDPEGVRTEVTERFGSEDELILVSTDASAEGLNLQERCHHLIHLELPYNPNRLEQRNGRIDRYGQRFVPQVTYLHLAGTFEERLLLRLVEKYERQRARLTFVPDTLGHLGFTTQEKSIHRLLEGLADEDHGLFAAPASGGSPSEAPGGAEAATAAGDETAAGDDDRTADDSSASDAAFAELCAEVDRAMSGFEESAKTKAWLGEGGLNATPDLVTAATRARAEGDRLGAVDLAAFVCTALEEETRSSNSILRHPDGTFELQLPETWTAGLDGLPGFDREARRLRLTTDRNLYRDTSGRPIGYLGRAHPLVRKALDRVRNIRFGEAHAYLDRRVSAALWDEPDPALLFTFLGTVDSRTGREYERVLAVLARRNGSTKVFTEPEDWLELADRGSQVTSTKGVWERYFQIPGTAPQEEPHTIPQQQACATAAAEAFEEVVAPFLDKQRDETAGDRIELDKWLNMRTHSLCGAPQTATAALFANTHGDAGEKSTDPPRWKVFTDPAERLAAFATDGTNPPARRREADGVLRLYRQRVEDLARRAELSVPAPTPLGILMLLPSSGDNEGGR